ncbi:VWA domain-containing protein [Spirillospora sp. NPDC127200]
MRKALPLAGALLMTLSLVLVPRAAAAERLAPVMLVLDASGSMQAKVAGGTRMDAARRAVRSLVGSVPPQARMGLTVYGTGTGSSDAEKAAGCKDIKVVQPVGPLDKNALVQAAEKATPRGYTPIGRSLRTAAAALPGQGPRSIVLVSDGEDTCAPPEPCQVARELARQGVDLRVHTIGYQVTGKAKSQLTCVAQVTGGTYTDVPDASGLGNALHRVTSSALRNYQPAGKPVTGTPAPQGAPVLATGGYLDTLGFQRKRHYSVEVPQGNTVYVAATAAFPRGGERQIAGLNVAVHGPGNVNCHYFENQVTSGGREGESVSAVLAWDTTKPSAPDACKAPGRYTFAVYFTGAQDTGPDSPDRVPLELQIGLEPPVTGDKGPAPASAPVSLAAQSGPGVPVSGGGSFGNAATLPGSGRYVEQLRFGEIVHYRVRLNWGQGLAYRVNYPARDLFGAANITSTLFSPSRQRAGWSTNAYSGTATSLPGNDKAFATLPVRYRNREAATKEHNAQSTAGWYYISVKLGVVSSLRQSDDLTSPLPVTLDLTVTGTPEKGPQYADASGRDLFGAAPPSASEPSAAAKPSAGKEAGDDSVPLWLLGAAGAAVLGVAAMVLFLILRRRSSGPRPPQGGPYSPF